jgi:hypothetical protein
MEHSIGNNRCEWRKFGEPFQVALMAIPSQASKEEGVETIIARLRSYFDYGEGIVQTTNTRSGGGENRSGTLISWSVGFESPTTHHSTTICVV